MNKGIWYGLIAYLMWGVFPIYWKLLSNVAPPEILVNRIIWSLIFLVVIAILRQNWQWVTRLFHEPKKLVWIAIAAVLLGTNWFIYIWGVNNGFIVETSLGYFINPLVNVFFGVVFLRERLRPGHWLAVFIAAAGVLYLTISNGSLPWIALSLAFSFGLYGLIKKKGSLGSTESLTTEMSILFIPALMYQLLLLNNHGSAWQANDWSTYLLLILSGPVTAIPLLFFGSAARLVPLSTLGVLQYIAPTMQFLIGVFLYGEPFTQTRLIGFAIIWIALLIFTFDNMRHRSAVKVQTVLED
jgi:chloramphenicol-sensitive protein RarD